MNLNPTRRISVALAAVLLLGAGPDGTRYAMPPSAPRMNKPSQGVLFADDFSSDSLGAWRPDRPGVWSLWRGTLRADLPDQKQLRSLVVTGDIAWTDIALDLDVCTVRGVDKGAVVRLLGGSGVGVDLRGGTYQDVVMYQRERSLGRAQATNANGTWNHLRVEARGNRFRVFVNGELKIDRVDAYSTRLSGRIALPAYTGGIGQCTVYYDNVVVTAIQ